MRFSLGVGLVLLSALLEILAFPPLNWYWFSFIFAVPLFIFLDKERRLLYLLGGFFVYRILVGFGTVYFTFDPIMFIASALIFMGLPISFYFISRLTKNLAFLSLLIFWPLWEYLEAYYTALPNFVMVAGNALGSSPFLGLASFGGLATLIIFVIFINLLIFAIYQQRSNKKQMAILIIGLVIALLLGYQLSQLFLNKNSADYQSLNNSKKLALVSDNGYLDKVFKNKNFNPSQLSQAIDEALTPLFDDLKNKDFDIVILPEAMIDIDFGSSINQEAFLKFKISNNGILIDKYGELANNLNKNLIANITSIQDGKRYNTILFFNNKGELVDIFNKKILAIAGEYWPFAHWRPFYLDWASNLDPQKYKDYAIFDHSKNFSRGETKSVRLNGLVFAPAICSEIHYLKEVKARVELNSNVILNISSNMWLSPELGLEKYLILTNNLRKIESVWLKIPIVVNGRQTPATLITPDGGIISSNYETPGKNYNIFVIDVKI